MIVGCFYHWQECLLVVGFLVTHRHKTDWANSLATSLSVSHAVPFLLSQGTRFVLWDPSREFVGDFWPERSQLEFIKCSLVILQIVKAHFRHVAPRPSDALWLPQSLLWLAHRVFDPAQLLLRRAVFPWQLPCALSAPRVLAVGSLLLPAYCSSLPPRVPHLAVIPRLSLDNLPCGEFWCIEIF